MSNKVFCRECTYWDDVPNSYDRNHEEGKRKIWGKCTCLKQQRVLQDGHWRKDGELPPVCYGINFFHTDLYWGCLDGKVKSQLKPEVATKVSELIVEDEIEVTDEYDDVLPF